MYKYKIIGKTKDPKDRRKNLYLIARSDKQRDTKGQDWVIEQINKGTIVNAKLEEGVVAIKTKDFLSVLVRCGADYGYGDICASEDDDYEFTATQYQSRIDLRSPNDDVLFGQLEAGKAYVAEVSTELEGVNAILDFWTLPSVKTYTAKMRFDTVHEALQEFRKSKDPFWVLEL